MHGPATTRRMCWLYQSNGADTEQTMLWLGWLAQQTQKTLRWTVITGQIRTEDV